MLPKDEQRLRDIKEAIGKARSYRGQLGPGGSMDVMVWEAILYNIAIIGEASKNLSKELRDQEPDVDWSPAAKMRDFVIHQYASTDLAIVAATVDEDLPRLEGAVDRLLGNG